MMSNASSVEPGAQEAAVVSRIETVLDKACAAVSDRYCSYPRAPSIERIRIRLERRGVSIGFPGHACLDDAEVLSQFKDEMLAVSVAVEELREVLHHCALPFEISVTPEIYLGKHVTTKCEEVEFLAAGILPSGKSGLDNLLAKLRLIDQALGGKAADECGDLCEWLKIQVDDRDERGVVKFFAETREEAELKAAASVLTVSKIADFINRNFEDFSSFDLKRLEQTSVVWNSPSVVHGVRKELEVDAPGAPAGISP